MGCRNKRGLLGCLLGLGLLTARTSETQFQDVVSTSSPSSSPDERAVCRTLEADPARLAQPTALRGDFVAQVCFGHPGADLPALAQRFGLAAPRVRRLGPLREQLCGREIGLIPSGLRDDLRRLNAELQRLWDSCADSGGLTAHFEADLTAGSVTVVLTNHTTQAIDARVDATEHPADCNALMVNTTVNVPATGSVEFHCSESGPIHLRVEAAGVVVEANFRGPPLRSGLRCSLDSSADEHLRLATQHEGYAACLRRELSRRQCAPNDLGCRHRAMLLGNVATSAEGLYTAKSRCQTAQLENCQRYAAALANLRYAVMQLRGGSGRTF